MRGKDPATIERTKKWEKDRKSKSEVKSGRKNDAGSGRIGQSTGRKFGISSFLSSGASFLGRTGNRTLTHEESGEDTPARREFETKRTREKTRVLTSATQRSTAFNLENAFELNRSPATARSSSSEEHLSQPTPKRQRVMPDKAIGEYKDPSEGIPDGGDTKQPEVDDSDGEPIPDTAPDPADDQENIPAPLINIDTVRVGGIYDVLDGKSRWCEAKVCKRHLSYSPPNRIVGAIFDWGKGKTES